MLVLIVPNLMVAETHPFRSIFELAKLNCSGVILLSHTGVGMLFSEVIAGS